MVVTPDNPTVRKIVADMYPSLSLSESTGVLKYGFSTAEVQKIKDTATDQVLEIIRNRIDQFGVAEPTILRQGANEIVVQLPGVRDPQGCRYHRKDGAARIQTCRYRVTCRSRTASETFTRRGSSVHGKVQGQNTPG